MASSTDPSGPVHPIDGVRLAAGASGLRYRGRNDVALIEVPPGGRTACLFTTNRFCAAPVTVARAHLGECRPRYLVVNAGNANAGTGKQGEADARQVCAAIAEAAGCAATEVLPFSTGVIGARMNPAPIEAIVPALLEALSADAWEDAAGAILTTDTRSKLRSRDVPCGAATYHVTGFAKGSGMIKPDMATMLAYVATDAPLDEACLQAVARRAADESFNCITVDGDTSTNDAFVLIASGDLAGAPIVDDADSRYAAVAAAVADVCRGLAQDIVRDGEGATHFVTLRVRGGESREDCRRVAYTVAESPLVKTALFAADPNWGRILAAIGRAGLERLDIARVCIAIGGHDIVRDGEPVPGYDEREIAAAMAETDVDIDIVLGGGPAAAEVWTCDLSYEYVKINAEYRS